MRALALGAAAAPVLVQKTSRRAVMALIWTAWGLSAALALGFLTQPVGAGAQLALCGAAMAAMAGLWIAYPRRGLPRTAFLALGSLVAIRYVYWRASGTLPALDDPLSFGLGLVLVAAELYCVLILTVSLVINADPLERGAAPTLADADLPSVDIFIPSYNEQTEILAVTVAAALNLDYPAGRASVWLLDDGGTDQKCADANPEKAAAAQARRAELQALCDAMGARYLTRAKNEHAKAGNLNAGLKASSAEIVLVLDADHAPFRPFLRETVGLFSTDPKLFLVQTPHVFLNPDPIERNLRTFSRMPSENEMFYGVTQRGLDKWNGSFFCGSAALLRRAALDTVGGFSGITITEDCETAFELHSRGWTSAYVDAPLIAGLQPETFADFIGQRARWCQGMFQIMILKNPLTKPGLSPIQRVAYLSSMAFWFFPLPRLIFMLAPLLHIFLDVKIFVSSIDEALAFTATYVVANMMIQNYLYGHVRWPWVSELYEYVQGVYLARSIVSVLMSPRKPSFTVTAKGVSLDNDHLSALAWPYFAIFGALAAGCAMAAWRYLYEPGVTSLMLVVGLWCLFNLVIAGAALGVVSERRQPERCPSLPVSRRGTLTLGADAIEVEILRAASDGCSLRRYDGAAWAGTDWIATLAPMPRGDGASLAALCVRPRGEAAAGVLSVAFAAMTPASYRAVADLLYGDTAPLRAFLAGRRRPVNLLSGSLRFLAWGAAEPVRAFTYAGRALRRHFAKAVPAIVPDVETFSIPTEVPVAVVRKIVADVTVAAAVEPMVIVPATAVSDPISQPVNAYEGAAEPVPVAPPALQARPISVEAWAADLRALVVAETADAGRTVSSFDPNEWRSCVAALDLADRMKACSDEPGVVPITASADIRGEAAASVRQAA